VPNNNIIIIIYLNIKRLTKRLIIVIKNTYLLSQYVSILGQSSIIDDSPFVLRFFEMRIWVKKKHLFYLEKKNVLITSLIHGMLINLPDPS